MLLVSREILFDVMRNKRNVPLSETDAGTPAFQAVCAKATDEYSKTTDMDLYSNAMLIYMNDNKQAIRFVGQGSSRIVFAMADGTALKLAKNKAGIAQNKQEIKTCLNPALKFKIFPDFYAADTKTYLALNCELCAKATQQDFKELFFAQPVVIADLIEDVFTSTKPNLDLDSKLQHLYDKMSSSFTSSPVARRLLKRLLDDRADPAIQSLYSLFQFYDKYGLDELLVGDLTFFENWGIAIRDNKKVLVIIDAGFSESVWQSSYAK